MTRWSAHLMGVLLVVSRGYVQLLSVSPPKNVPHVAQCGHECQAEVRSTCIHVLCKGNTEGDLTKSQKTGCVIDECAEL